MPPESRAGIPTPGQAAWRPGGAAGCAAPGSLRQAVSRSARAPGGDGTGYAAKRRNGHCKSAHWPCTATATLQNTHNEKGPGVSSRAFIHRAVKSCDLTCPYRPCRRHPPADGPALAIRCSVMAARRTSWPSQSPGLGINTSNRRAELSPAPRRPLRLSPSSRCNLPGRMSSADGPHACEHSKPR